MNKYKLLWCALLVAVASNGVLLWKCFSRADRPGHRREPKHLIIEKLKFNSEQCVQYDALIQQHRQDVSAMEQEIMHARRELYRDLLFQSTANDSLVAFIAARQGDIERVHYKHFFDIKTICRPEQMVEFESLIPELPNLFNPKHRQPH